MNEKYSFIKKHEYFLKVFMPLCLLSERKKQIAEAD